MNRIEHLISNYQFAVEKRFKQDTRIQDVKTASRVSEVTKQQMLEQSSRTKLVQANTEPRAVLDLLV